MNRTVKLYCSVKRPSGDWGTKPVPDKQLMNFKDLPEGQGHYYLAYYEGKHRQMPPVGRFADAAKQKLVQKRKELDARATGVELPPETKPEPTEESNLAPRVEKYLSQMMAFVGNDGCGRTKKSVNPYRNRLKFYQRFCAQKRITDLRPGDYDHLLEFVGWLRKRLLPRATGIGKGVIRKLCLVAPKTSGLATAVTMAYVRYVLADENRSLRTLPQPVSRSRQKRASRLCHESRDALLSLA